MKTEKEALERTLEEIERSQPGYERYKGVIAAAYALWLGRENDVTDVEDLPAFLDAHESDPNVRGFLTRELANHWQDYRPHVTRFDKELLRQVALEHAPEGGHGSPVPPPKSVIDLAIEILAIAPGDYVADLGTGMGSFLCHACERAPHAHYTGYENLTDYSAVASLRAKLLRGDVAIVMPCTLFDNFEAVRFDKAFCSPLWRRWDDVQLMARKFLAKQPAQFPKLKKNASDGWIYALKMLSTLNYDGKAVLTLPIGGLSGKLDAGIRRYLLEREEIEAVILLPRGLYDFTSQSMALVVLGYGNQEVLMIDATHMGTRNWRGAELEKGDVEEIVAAIHGKPQKWAAKVCVAEIIAREDMNPVHYTQEEIKFQSPAKFGDVVKEVVKGMPVKPRDTDDMDDAKPTPFQYVSIGNVNDGMIDEDLPDLRRVVNYSQEKRYCLCKNDIVLARSSLMAKDDGGRSSGRPGPKSAGGRDPRRNDDSRTRTGVSFKVALADPARGQLIVVNESLLIIRVDEAKADPWYVKAFLESEVGQATLRRVAVGSTMQNLGIEAIKSMSFPLPPMDKQREIAERHRKGMEEVLRLRRELDAAMRKRDESSNDFDDLVESPSGTGKEAKTNDCLGK